MLTPRAHARSATQMGVSPAGARARARDDANRGPVPVEFPMAAFFPFNSGDLCGGSTGSLARDERSRMLSSMDGVTNPGYNANFSRRFDGDFDVGFAHRRALRFSINVDLSWTRYALVSLGIYSTPFRISRLGARVRQVWSAACHISLDPAKLRRSQIQSLARVN